MPVGRTPKDLVQTAEAVIAEVFPTLNDDDLQVGLSAVYEEFCEMRRGFLGGAGEGFQDEEGH